MRVDPPWGLAVRAQRVREKITRGCAFTVKGRNDAFASHRIYFHHNIQIVQSLHWIGENEIVEYQLLRANSSK